MRIAFFATCRADTVFPEAAEATATSDIETCRVEGVHGPRNVHVVVVPDDPSHVDAFPAEQAE